MTIKVKMQELVIAKQAFQELLKKDVNTEVMFLLSLAFKKIDPELSVFEERRNAAVKTYGKQNEKGEIGIAPDDIEALQKFDNEIKPILDTEVTIDVTPIEISKLGNDKILGAITHALTWLFVKEA